MKTVLHFEGKKIGAEEMSRSPSATKRNEGTRKERKGTGEGNCVVHTQISREQNVSYVYIYIYIYIYIYACISSDLSKYK